jgi:hypothetical protein
MWLKNINQNKTWKNTGQHGELINPSESKDSLLLQSLDTI